MPIVKVTGEELIEVRGSVAGGLHRGHRLGRDARDLLEGQLGRQSGHVGVAATDDHDPLHRQTVVVVQEPADTHVQRLEL